MNVSAVPLPGCTTCVARPLLDQAPARRSRSQAVPLAQLIRKPSKVARHGADQVAPAGGHHVGGVGEVARGRVAALIGEGETGPVLIDLDALIPMNPWPASWRGAVASLSRIVATPRVLPRARGVGPDRSRENCSFGSSIVSPRTWTVMVLSRLAGGERERAAGGKCSRPMRSPGGRSWFNLTTR